VDFSLDWKKYVKGIVEIQPFFIAWKHIAEVMLVPLSLMFTVLGITSVYLTPVLLTFAAIKYWLHEVIPYIYRSVYARGIARGLPSLRRMTAYHYPFHDSYFVDC
jgi:hypothetical protein